MFENVITPKRGEIWNVNFSNAIGCQQAGERPAVIVLNDKSNIYSPIVTVCPLTSKMKKNPAHVYLSDYVNCGLKEPSTILVEQTTSINKFQMKQRIGTLSDNKQRLLNRKIMFQLIKS